MRLFSKSLKINFQFFFLQPASSADIWRWVHSVYGDELGLTSEDENDYVSPYVTPEGSGPTSKVTSVCPSPKPASKKLHTAMSVPANLKDASVSMADLKIISPDQFNLSLENNAVEVSNYFLPKNQLLKNDRCGLSNYSKHIHALILHAKSWKVSYYCHNYL